MSTGSNVDILLTKLNVLLSEYEDPELAKGMMKYMKNKFSFLGIQSPQRRAITLSWLPLVKSYDVDMWEIIFRLWDFEEREYQYIALDYLQKVPVSKIQRDDISKLEALITHKSWWDSVDSLASNYVGKYFKKYPDEIDNVISKWRYKNDIWLNRSCLIFQLKYKDDVDFNLLSSLIIQYKDEKEFFIQKAIGWSLRQYSKFSPNAVKEFVEEVGLEGLAKREAIKYI